MAGRLTTHATLPPPVDDTILSLTDEELKDLLRRGFAYGNPEKGMPEEALDEFVLLIRRRGFAAFLEVLESAEHELLRPPA